MTSRPLALLAVVATALALVACAPASAPPAADEPSAGQQDLDAQLRDAAWADDVDGAAELIARGADVNAKDDTQQSAYLIATSEGHLELLRLTLAHGARVDDKDSWNGTGLIRAAERGHGHVVGELLRAGIDRDHVNRIGYQAIHEAVIFGEDTPEYATTVRALIAGGVELDRPSGNEGRTPLQMAEDRGLDGLRTILAFARDAEVPADPDAALRAAARAGDADASAVALRAGAAIDVPDPESGRTPLQDAVSGGHDAVADLLVAMGADRG
ncbi:ankyrin repeat domain-containing protein [Microbacterium sp.]|uniref:ankyrin repeat domain-containing protein n=1 Tax=Microbacterium sp. TaxID=51671 RepID=UPI002810F091|nr:ankyrin repeat domain-containing protein [Microbacterium sp.]